MVNVVKFVELIMVSCQFVSRQYLAKIIFREYQVNLMNVCPPGRAGGAALVRAPPTGARLRRAHPLAPRWGARRRRAGAMPRTCPSPLRCLRCIRRHRPPSARRRRAASSPRPPRGPWGRRWRPNGPGGRPGGWRPAGPSGRRLQHAEAARGRARPLGPRAAVGGPRGLGCPHARPHPPLPLVPPARRKATGGDRWGAWGRASSMRSTPAVPSGRPRSGRLAPPFGTTAWEGRRAVGHIAGPSPRCRRCPPASRAGMVPPRSGGTRRRGCDARPRSGRACRSPPPRGGRPPDHLGVPPMGGGGTLQQLYTRPVCRLGASPPLGGGGR